MALSEYTRLKVNTNSRLKEDRVTSVVGVSNKLSLAASYTSADIEQVKKAYKVSDHCQPRRETLLHILAQPKPV